MSQNDLISVVISAYNHERYVQETLKSILAQTYTDIELIIVNDGSPDNTHKKIEEILPACHSCLSRVEYINKQNEGVIRSLNKCLALAQGQYVYFIASDDVAEPQAIEVLHNFLDQHPDYGLAVGNNKIIDSQSQRCYWGRKRELLYNPDEAYALTFGDYLHKRNPDINFNGSDFGSYPQLLSGNYVPNGFLVRKNLLDKIGGYSESAGLEDLHLMLQISKHTKMKYIDRILFQYRWHETNTIHASDSTKRKQDMYDTLALEIPYAKKHGLLHLIPREKCISFLSFKLFEYKKNGKRTKLLTCKLCIYQSTLKKNRQTISIFGIPVWSKKIPKGSTLNQQGVSL
jgi:alpha-1,3-rhamnosyltransferase